MSNYDISIIIPVYREDKNISDTLHELNQISIIKGISLEVIIVNAFRDSDSRKSYPISRYPALHVKNISLKKRMRLGELIRTCCAYSSGDYVLTLTGEGTQDLDLLEEIYVKILKNIKLIIISRFEIVNKDSKTNFVFYQKIYRTLIWILLGQRILDSTNGFRAFDRRFVQALGVSRPGLSFFAEMTIKVLQAGGSIESISVKNYLQNSSQISNRILNLQIPEKFKFKSEIFGYIFVIISAICFRISNFRNAKK